MTFRESPQWLDACVEVFPPTAITMPHQTIPIGSLHVEGGIVEVADMHDFSPMESKVVLLGSIGLSNQQSADALFYSKRAIEWNQKNAYSKLKIPSGPGRTLGIQGTHELFSQRYMRVVAPIEPPILSDRELEIFGAVIRGMTLAEVSSGRTDLTFPQATHALTSLRTKFGVKETKRAVLLGHIGHVLDSPATHTLRAAATERSDAFTLHAAKDDGVVDYLNWQGGVVSFRLGSGLDGVEQQSLLISSIVPSISRAAAALNKPEAAFKRMRTSAIQKLGARTVAHGLGIASKQGDLRVTRTTEAIDLDKNEGLLLDALSSGLTQNESASMLGISFNTMKDVTYSMYEKMHVRTAGAAVLKGLISGSLHASSLTDTSVA